MSRYTKSMTDALQQVDDRTQEFDEEVKWEVKITGLPTFYSDGKSRGEVKQALRKLLKRPDDIVSIERTTPAALKKIRRGQAAGTEPGDGEEAEKVKEEVKINRIIEAQSVDDVINMIQFGHPFKVVEEIPAELPGPEVPRYKNASNATVDKEDKKANKIKDKAEKGTLIPTQTKEEVEGWDPSTKTKGKLPKHLTKFLDRHGNPNPEAQARIDAGRRERAKRAAAAAKPKITDVTPKGYGPSEEIATGIPLSKALAGTTTPPKQKKGFRGIGKPPEAGWKTRKAGTKAGDMTTAEYDPTLDEWGDTSILSTQRARIAGRPDFVPKTISSKNISKTGLSIKKGREALDKDKKNQNKDPVGPQHEMAERLLKKLREVSPPRWGHTVPDEPKGAKVGGTAQAMKKAQERGDIPKDMNIYALMWSMKNKGDNPHYKPGEKGVLKKKYKNDESVLDSAKRYVIDERADWETAFKSASQSRPAMKYKDAAAFIETAGLNSSEKRTALKSAKKWLK